MEIGSKVGHYEIVKKLGQGGMGVVYQAVDTRLERPVALKVLPPELMSDPERSARFLREAKAASAVNHPAIAQIYGIETEGDASFIAMEFIDGATARQLIQRDELDVLSAIDIGIQVASALQSAHDAGIVHRDIKSDNIMVTRDGHPKVLDFGLAKLVDNADEAGSDQTVTTFQTMAMKTAAISQTEVGAVLGTVAYMSPEQARGLPADKRSDIFSFGIVLYEMATGKLPFSGESALDTMHAIAFNESQPISDLKAGLPYSLQRVVNRCLEKQADHRYQSMAEIAEALTAIKRELESGVSSSAPFMDRLSDRFRRLAARAPGGKAIGDGALSGRGVLFLALWGTILVVLIIVVLANEGGLGGILPFAVIGFFVYRRYQTQRRRLMRKFANKAKKEKPVRLISSDGDRFLVVLEEAPAKTLVKINSLLESVNGSLYRGQPFEMEIETEATEEQFREWLLRPGLLFVRDPKVVA